MLSMYEGLDYDYNRSLENVKIIISIIYLFTVLFDSRYRENLDSPNPAITMVLGSYIPKPVFKVKV